MILKVCTASSGNNDVWYGIVFAVYHGKESYLGSIQLLDSLYIQAICKINFLKVTQKLSKFNFLDTELVVECIVKLVLHLSTIMSRR